MCRLERSLYGLKQSPKQEHRRFECFILSHSFTRCSYDSSVYMRSTRARSLIYLVLYVDYMLVFCKRMLEVEDLKEQLLKEFDIKDLGDAKKILGMEIVKDRNNRFLYSSQKRYIDKVLKRFSMDNAIVISTHLGSHFLLSKDHFPRTKQEEDDMQGVQYKNFIKR